MKCWAQCRRNGRNLQNFFLLIMQWRRGFGQYWLSFRGWITVCIIDKLLFVRDVWLSPSLSFMSHCLEYDLWIRRSMRHRPLVPPCQRRHCRLVYNSTLPKAATLQCHHSMSIQYSYWYGGGGGLVGDIDSLFGDELLSGLFVREVWFSPALLSECSWPAALRSNSWSTDPEREPQRGPLLLYLVREGSTDSLTTWPPPRPLPSDVAPP